MNEQDKALLAGVKLPCGVRVGPCVFRAGVPLLTFIGAAERWYEESVRLFIQEHPDLPTAKQLEMSLRGEKEHEQDGI